MANHYWDDDIMEEIDFDEDWDDWDNFVFKTDGRKKFTDYHTAISRLADSLFDQQQAM